MPGLVGTASRFFYAGGLSDFRADSIASSLYGVTLCCFLLSDWLCDKRWSRFTVGSAAWLCWNRPIAGVYLAVVFALLQSGVLIQWWRSRDNPSPRRVAIGMGQYALMFGVLTMPILILGRTNFYNYYVVGHVVGPEKKIRALEQGVRTLVDHLGYYPGSLTLFHLGLPILKVWVAMLAAAMVLVLLVRLRYSQNLDQSRPSSPARWGIPLLWSLVPLSILTLDESKSPVVASIVVAPCVLTGALLLHHLLLALPTRAPAHIASIGYRALAVVSLLTGMTFMASAEARPAVARANVAGIRALMRAYLDLATYIEYFEIEQPKLATDRILEYFNGAATGLSLIERSGLYVRPKELLAYDIFDRSAADAVRAAHEADCALVTLGPLERTRPTLFPFERSTAKWQSAYRDVVQREMIPLARISLGPHDFQIFVRPRVRVAGASEGWLTATGASIQAPVKLLREWPIIRITGTTIASQHLKGPLSITAVARNDAGVSTTIPARITISPGESYQIEIDATGVPLPDSPLLALQLSFDRYFVPKELGQSTDTRKLVIQSPKASILVRGNTVTAPPALSAREIYPY